MILSNEPGYYREGAFGIRIENLIVVTEAPRLPEGDARDMLCFDTLTWAPIDRRLVRADDVTAKNATGSTPTTRAWPTASDRGWTRTPRAGWSQATAPI
jgi:hypothetical protein